MTNLFADLPPSLPNELFTTPLDAANGGIEQIVPPAAHRPKASGSTRNSTSGSLC
jgi:hypothetical protein